MTTSRTELGISPVLFQAIAQLTASASTTNPTQSSVDIQAQMSTSKAALVKQAHANNKQMEDTQTTKDASRVVSQLLQKLNEPVVSLIPHSRSASQLLASTAMNRSLAVSESSRSTSFTQAGLSMLGIASENNNNTINQMPATSAVSQPTQQLPMQQVPASFSRTNVLGEELNNFLLKQEPVEYEVTSPSTIPPPVHTQTINTDVSSVLSALASQHIHQQQIQSVLQRNETNQQQQNSLPNTYFQIVQPSSNNATSTAASQSLSGVTAVASNINVTHSEPSRSQHQPQQIIIYGVQYDNNNIITAPGPSASSSLGDDSDNNLVIEEGANSAGSNGQQTTFRVHVQSSGNNSADQKTLVLPSGGSFSSTNVVQQTTGSISDGVNMQPISDVQNSFEGMNQPCPVCGDKVSGYHYGIFTCESCKGFFKRTVQNKKTFICPKSSDCIVNSVNRKKCPACRFKRCLLMGMKLEAIRQDRTRGGRSSYEGCTPQKTRLPAMVKKPKKFARTSGDLVPGPSQEIDDGSKSHRNLVAILNHNLHKQSSPSPGTPVIPELLRDIMNLEPLLSDDDIPPDSIMESGTFPDQALYSYMMQLAELRLYKLVRWARNLPQFGAISTDDQILLLQNCWSELIALALCWRSIDTPNQISISSTHHITTEWAQHIGCEDMVARLLSITNSFRNLFMDEYEYVALKVLLLISPDVKGLKEPRKIRDFQDKLMEALMIYTMSHYQDIKNKFGELLLRLPELSRLSFLSKNILLKYLPTSSTTCGLLVELLKGDSRLEQESSGGASGVAAL